MYPVRKQITQDQYLAGNLVVRRGHEIVSFFSSSSGGSTGLPGGANTRRDSTSPIVVIVLGARSGCFHSLPRLCHGLRASFLGPRTLSSGTLGSGILSSGMLDSRSIGATTGRSIVGSSSSRGRTWSDYDIDHNTSDGSDTIGKLMI